MRLLLRRTLENVGKIGDVVDVSDGFGRNYLLPQRHAVPVTLENRRRIEVEKIDYAKQEAALFTAKRYGIIEGSTKSGKTVGTICVRPNVPAGQGSTKQAAPVEPAREMGDCARYRARFSGLSQGEGP